jgi:poly(3-hydroxyalkanoate) synthetase
MSSLRLLLLLTLITKTASAISPEDAASRLRMAWQIARERNDEKLVRGVEKLAHDFKSGLPADAEEQLREAERAVGIDPGG